MPSPCSEGRLEAVAWQVDSQHAGDRNQGRVRGSPWNVPSVVEHLGPFGGNICVPAERAYELLLSRSADRQAGREDCCALICTGSNRTGGAGRFRSRRVRVPALEDIEPAEGHVGRIRSRVWCCAHAAHRAPWPWASSAAKSGRRIVASIGSRERERRAVRLGVVICGREFRHQLC